MLRHFYFRDVANETAMKLEKVRGPRRSFSTRTTNGPTRYFFEGGFKTRRREMFFNIASPCWIDGAGKRSNAEPIRPAKKKRAKGAAAKSKAAKTKTAKKSKPQKKNKTSNAKTSNAKKKAQNCEEVEGEVEKIAIQIARLNCIIFKFDCVRCKF